MKDTFINAFAGINNVVEPEYTPSQYLKKALNIDINKQGSLIKRKGYTKKDDGNYTALWASNSLCYGVKDGNLIAIDQSYSSYVVKADIGTQPISFEEIDGTVYYCHEYGNGKLVNGQHKEWGVEKNKALFTLIVWSGTLLPGDYQVAITFVADDGIESGTSKAQVITVSTGGIKVSIPTHTNPDVIKANIYCSEPNGTVLYYCGSSELDSDFVINDLRFTTPLRTFGLDKPPTGHIVTSFSGRMFIAQDSVLWWSNPWQYSHFDLINNYAEFPSRIKSVMPVEDGIWVASDRLYFLAGQNPDSFALNVKDNVSAVSGTETKITGNFIGVDGVDATYKWLLTTNNGIYLLANQGVLLNLTSKNVSLRNADSGTATFLQHSGLNQYLSLLKVNQLPNNSAVGDYVDATIIRKGVPLN